MKTPARLLAALLALANVALAADRPNIVFIFSDDHALEAISAYGNRFNETAPTPNIDRIASEGMLFERSYCANSICGPSRATILTGKHSHLNGFMDNNFSRFDGTQQTFPKLLQEAGYDTAMIGKWHLVSNPTGFNYWEILPGQGNYYNPDFIQMDGKEKRFEGYVTDLVTDKSIEWLKSRNDKAKPFMLMCQQKAPHRNWVPAERHMDLFDDISMPEPDSLFDDYKNRVGALAKQEMEISENFSWSHDMLLPGEPTDPRFVNSMDDKEYKRMNTSQKASFDNSYGPENQELIKNLAAGMSDQDLTRWKYQRYIKNYLRCIRAVDENVGRVLDYLEEAGLAENTIVIYSSDQGFYLGEHGWYDKRWMFEESLSMPFIMKWPGVAKPGSRSTALIQNIDYAPTFLDIAGADIPSDIQGVSLLPVLKNEGKSPEGWRDAIYYQYSGEPTHAVARHDGVRNKRYKLMRFPDTNEWMLIDLEKDPQEMKSVYAEAEYSDIVPVMMETYNRLREKYGVSDSTFPKQRYDAEGWKARWDKLNSSLDQPDSKKAEVVFLGDSITQGFEGPGGEAWEQHFSPFHPINMGFSGDRTEHLIWRLQNGDIQRIAPKVAVIEIGTNNAGQKGHTAASVSQGIRTIVEDLAWKWPDTKVILMAIFPRGDSADDPQRKINDQVNEKINALADGKRVHYLNINSQLMDESGKPSEKLFPDRLHLSPEAYQIWAAALASKIENLGLTKNPVLPE